jgi:Macrocin-O-methyltransferase (TylF)
MNTAELYLNLLKLTLTGIIQGDPPISVSWRPESVYDERRRWEGRDWPLHAHTMIGMKRLDNLQYCTETVIGQGIPGDFIETGVWRGGACIFMRGVLAAYQELGRRVWVADSFSGFPPLNDLIAVDDRTLASQPEQAHLAVSMEEVISNFRLYGLMDKQVQMLPGWFSETLPGPIDQLAVLRLDSDLYESTIDSITPLYPLLSPGGFCIVDDWNVPMCKAAIMDYRSYHGVKEPMEDIDGHSVYWQKES